jgi:hypothetical protein
MIHGDREALAERLLAAVESGASGVVIWLTSEIRAFAFPEAGR